MIKDMITNNMDNEIKPALLTRSEVDWLSGKKQVSKSYEYYMKNMVRSKLKTLVELELPLLIERGFSDSIDLSVFTKNLSANSKIGKGMGNRSESYERRCLVAGPEGFDPSTSGLEGKRSIQTEICFHCLHIASGLFGRAILSYGPVTMIEPL